MSLQQMLAKFNTGQTEDAITTAKKEKKVKSKAAAPPKTAAKDAKQDEGKADGGKPGVKLRISKDMLKGSQNGFAVAPKPEKPAPSVASSATAAPASSVPAASRAIGKKVKDILDCLLAAGKSLNAQEILEQTNLDVRTDQDLYNRLAKNERVQINGTLFSYKPQHDICDRTSLLNFIRDRRHGTYVSEIKDSYKGILEDIAELQREQVIIVINHPDQQQDALFARDMMDMAVDSDVVELYHEVSVPLELLELQAAVAKAGLRSALANQPMKRAISGMPKEKKKKQRVVKVNISKATNAHLPFLFTGEQPKNIDER